MTATTPGLPCHARLMLAGLLAAASLGAAAAEPVVRVLSFNPQGAVPAAQQVRASFSEPMQPLGKLSAPPPFDMDCALKGQARWADDRTWVMELDDEQFDGQDCSFRIKPGLLSVAGRAVGEPLAFSFRLPKLTADMKRRVQDVLPRRDADWIAEDQVFLLSYSQPLGDATPDVRCEAPGQPEAPVLRLPVAVRDQMLPWHRRRDAADRSEAVRCPFALAPESRLTLRLVRPGLKPDVMSFKVRSLPAVSVDCDRLPGSGDCAASRPIRLQFNAALPEALLREIRLEDDEGSRAGEVAVDAEGLHWSAKSSVSFAAPGRPQAQYRIRWPQQALADISGRPLSPERLPTRIGTLPALGLAIFSAPAISIRPLQADNAVPVLLQGSTTVASVRTQIVARGGHDVAADREILRRLRILERLDDDGVGHFFCRKHCNEPRSDPRAPLLPDSAATLPLQPLDATAAPAPRRAQVSLQGAGLHLLELQAVADGAEGGPLYDSVAVLLTRLAVHLKLARENGAVWVTQLDGGAPVAGVALRAYDCRGELVWQGRSDAQGLATIDRQALARCGSHPDAGVSVVARHTWPDGERDLAVANSRWAAVLDGNSYGVPDGRWDNGSLRAHTVLDRPLFKPGETVSMRHVVRVENNLGLTLPQAHTLPVEATIQHSGSGKEWTVPLAWATPGEGTSSFGLPKDAPLGHYSVQLKISDPAARAASSRAEFTAAFAVKAFRLPAMSGGIQASQPRLLIGTAPTLQLALHYADGGAAQHWPVTVKVYAQAHGHRRPQVLDSYPNGQPLGTTADGEAQPLLLTSQSLQLDAQGQARATLPELPARTRPYVLHVELDYQDPNGEALTLSQDFDVQPSLLSLGVRTSGLLAVQRPLLVQSLAVDENGLRRSGQALKLSASWQQNYKGPVQDLGEICQGRTDAQGQLVCRFVPAKAGTYQFHATATGPDGRTVSAHSWSAATQPPSVPSQPLFLNADRALYREGDTARIAITSPFARSHAWLTLEREGVLESRVLTLDAARHDIRLPIRPEWAGNVAVSLLALDAGAPALATGITTLAVSTEARALKLSVKPDRPRYQPGDHASVRIHVATAKGKPLPAARRLSFVAVDEALLTLKDNASWQLLARMQRPRPQGVHTVSGLTMNPPVDEIAMRGAAESVLMWLIRSGPSASLGARRAGAIQMAQAIKPGIEVDTSPEPPRQLLEALLHWQVDVPVDGEGNAVVTFPIKDSLSRFRLVAIASAGNEDFGTGMAHLDVAKDVQITAGLPPRVREGDRFAALVTVRNTTSHAITLDARARLDGQPALPAQAMRLAAGASRQLRWNVTVPAGAKALDWTFTARERGGAGRQDALAITQQVEPAVPVTVQAATLAQVTGSWELPAFGFGSSATRDARVAVRLLPSLAGQLSGVQAWLAAYPYRCLEQSASRAVGQHDRAAWDAVMAELPRYLDGDGLASYFPPNPASPSQGSDTLTAYLLDLSAATGWPLPDDARARMLGALERFVAGKLTRKFWAPRDDSLARQLAAMATLARHQRLHRGPFEALRVDVDEWTSAMLIDWLAIVRKTGQRPDTQSMAENALRARLSYQGRRLGLSTEQRDYWWWLMHNGDVDAARLLLTVADLPGWQADLPRLLNGLLARRQAHGAWATTNANAWGTLAVDAFAKAMEPVPVAGATRITLGSNQRTVDWSAPPKAPLDVALNPATDALHIQHDGPGAPWASVEVRAAVPLTAPRFAGYGVSRSITPVQQKVAGRWHVGDVLRVRLSIRAQADMSWVVVDDPVPAGASLLGSGLGRDSATARAGEESNGSAWPLYQARDFTSFKSFYRYVPRGDFSLEYTIRLNNPGQFALPPTRVEAMYAPEIFGEVPNAALSILP